MPASRALRTSTLVALPGTLPTIPSRETTVGWLLPSFLWQACSHILRTTNSPTDFHVRLCAEYPLVRTNGHLQASPGQSPPRPSASRHTFLPVLDPRHLSRANR